MGGGEAAGAVAEVAEVGGYRRFGEGSEGEGQGGGRDVVPAFEVEGELDGGEVAVVVLALCGLARAGVREQAECLPVAQHPGGRAQAFRGFGDAHAANLDISVSKTPVRRSNHQAEPSRLT